MHRQRIRIDERKVYNHVLSRKCTEVIPNKIFFFILIGVLIYKFMYSILTPNSRSKLAE